MDLNVHRLRFGDWKPAPIKSIAVDPFSSKVAIGREDGDIEICNSVHKWYVQARAPGQKDFKLQCLTWAALISERGRLFGISLRGFIFELDLSTLLIKHVRDSYGGAAWCLASCKRHGLLAVGCEDGAARLFSYEDGALEYTRSLPTTGARVLCVAFHPALPQLFLGCDDGTIRCVEETTGRGLFRMIGDVLRGVSTYILSIIVLSDSTVVTGDSRGHVQLWDGETGVLMVTLHQHTADVLSLAASPDETQIFASGVDCRVTCVRKIAQPSVMHQQQLFKAKYGDGGLADDAEAPPTVVSSPSDNTWVYGTSHRPHSHDVYTLAVCHCTDPYGPAPATSASATFTSSTAVLVSGGMDTKLCSYSIDEFARTRPAWILPVPARGLVQASQDYSLVAVRHRHCVDLWTVVPKGEGTASDGLSAPSSSAGSMSSSKSSKSSKISSSSSGSSSSGASSSGGIAHRDEVVSPEDHDGDGDDDDRCRIALRIERSTSEPEHVHCFAMCPRGRALACSSAAGTRVYAITRSTSASSSSHGYGKGLVTGVTGRQVKDKDNGPKVGVRKLDLPPGMGSSFAQAMAFSADGRRLVAYCVVPEGHSTGSRGRSNGNLVLMSLVECEKSGDGTDKEDEDKEEEEDEEEDEEEGVGRGSRKRAPTKKQSSAKKAKKGPRGPKASSAVGLKVQLWHTFDHSATARQAAKKSRKSAGGGGGGGGSGGGGMVALGGDGHRGDGLESAVTSLVFSTDGLWLAVADADRAVYVYDLDRLRLHWRLPLCSAPVTALAFHPRSTASLVVAQADHLFLVYEVDCAGGLDGSEGALGTGAGAGAGAGATLGQGLSVWSQLNTSRIPEALKSIAGPICGIAFPHSEITTPGLSSTTMILHGQGFLVHVDLAQAIPRRPKIINATAPPVTLGRLQDRGSSAKDGSGASGSGGGVNGTTTTTTTTPGPSDKKRKGKPTLAGGTSASRTSIGTSRGKRGRGHDNDSEGATSSNFAIVQRYRSLVHVGCLDGSQLVVVENPWVRILGNLPDTLARKRYGT